MDNMEKKIVVEDLSVSFDGTHALSNVSLDVFKGEILTIIGPANSGKTTLLSAINRTLEIKDMVSITGRILLDGKDINESEPEEIRRRVGMVYALPIPLPMSIRDNVLLGIRLQRRLKRSEEDDILEKTLRAAFLWEEVKDRLNTSAIQLSGGQQQRLCIARTLAVKPEVILFDEPCSGLDPISTMKVEEALKELVREHTIVFVTNNTKQAARIGTRTAFLLMGRLVEVDATEKLFTVPSCKETEDYITGQFG